MNLIVVLCVVESEWVDGLMKDLWVCEFVGVCVMVCVDVWWCEDGDKGRIVVCMKFFDDFVMVVVGKMVSARGETT